MLPCRRGALAAGALAGSLLLPRPLPAQGSADTVDSAVALADRAIASGKPWQATRILGRLGNPANTTPVVRLAAARAAIGWEGWDEATRLLAGATWLDRANGGEGRRLLARAAVERRRSAEALAHVEAARPPADPEAAADWAVIVGRALELSGSGERAAASYEKAAAASDIADWLRLRAAGLLADSAQRDRLYRQIDAAEAKDRIPLTEARALERQGSAERAARRYDALGMGLTAIRLRLGQSDTATRARARRALAELIGTPLSASDASQAIALYDLRVRDRSAVEELRLARLAARINQAERAVAGFTRAGMSRLTDRDRLTNANLLAQLGRYPEATAMYDAVRPGPLRGDAAYFRARAILRSGRPAVALDELARVVERHPEDAEPAARALYLMGDLTVDRVSDDSARAIFRTAFVRYPNTVFGRRAGFQAAFIAYLRGDVERSAREFDELAARAGTDESSASMFWAGQAWERARDTVAARSRWERLLARDGDTYYAVLAARRLGRTLWRFDVTPTSLPDISKDALERAAHLRRVGFRAESGWELDGFEEAAGRDPARLLATARALAENGHSGRAVRAALNAQARGARLDRALAEMLYPLPFRDVLVGEAAAAGVDPLLVASLIRQESAFEPRARSVADARGLMQILPSVGEAYARRNGVGQFDPVLLYQPDVNLDFGIEHLAEAIDRFGSVERALAAYNAGADRVTQWLSQRGADQDALVFAERIPFAETRDYVRKVIRNHAFYQALYNRPVP